MRITTADKIIIAALLIFNGWLFTNWGTSFGEGDWVVITVNQKETARLPLNANQTTHIKGPLGLTEIELKKGQARIIRSPCKNKVCIKSGYIRYTD